MIVLHGLRRRYDSLCGPKAVSSTWEEATLASVQPTATLRCVTLRVLTSIAADLHLPNKYLAYHKLDITFEQLAHQG